MIKMSKAYLVREEVEKLEEAAKCVRDKLLIRLLFYSGARISEVIPLEVKNVDFSQGTVTIQHLKSRINLACPDCGVRLGRKHIFCPRCGVKVNEAVAKEQEHRKVRTIPLDRGTLKMLADYINRGGPLDRNGKELFFNINRHRAWQIIRECARSAGLTNLVNPETGKTHGISPHKLRDAFAVNAMKLDNTGDGLRMLQEHLGHANFNTTAKYRKISGDEQRDWYQKLWLNEVKPKDDTT
jgi:integrase/recombinase XerD